MVAAALCRAALQLVHGAADGPRGGPSQYCSIDYQAVLRKHGLLISMSGKGNCYPICSVVRKSPLETFRLGLQSQQDLRN